MVNSEISQTSDQLFLICTPSKLEVLTFKATFNGTEYQKYPYAPHQLFMCGMFGGMLKVKEKLKTQL